MVIINSTVMSSSSLRAPIVPLDDGHDGHDGDDTDTDIDRFVELLFPSELDIIRRDRHYGQSLEDFDFRHEDESDNDEWHRLDDSREEYDGHEQSIEESLGDVYSPYLFDVEEDLRLLNDNRLSIEKKDEKESTGTGLQKVSNNTPGSTTSTCTQNTAHSQTATLKEKTNRRKKSISLLRHRPSTLEHLQRESSADSSASMIDVDELNKLLSKLKHDESLSLQSIQDAVTDAVIDAASSTSTTASTIKTTTTAMSMSMATPIAKLKNRKRLLEQFMERSHPPNTPNAVCSH